MRAAQKLGLGAIFCLALVTIVLDVLRSVLTITGGTFADPDFFVELEVTLGIIILALPTYRALVSIKRRRTGNRYVDLEYRNNNNRPDGVRLNSVHKTGDASVHQISSKSIDSTCTEQSTTRGVFERYPPHSRDGDDGRVSPVFTFSISEPRGGEVSWRSR